MGVTALGGAMGSVEAASGTRAVEGVAEHHAGLLGTGAEHVLDQLRLGLELLAALAERCEQRVDLGQQGLLGVAEAEATALVVAAHLGELGAVGEQRVELEDQVLLVVERVVQVTPSRLLWVQVRSTSQAEAYRVLDSVRTHGI